MNSIIINVNIELINLEPKYIDKKYISFVDYVVNENDYIEILFKNYRVDWKVKTPELDKKIKNLNEKEFQKFIDTLIKIYDEFKKNPKKYEKMISNTRKKIEKLNNERVYSYIYKCIKLNSKYIKN